MDRKIDRVNSEISQQLDAKMSGFNPGAKYRRGNQSYLGGKDQSEKNTGSKQFLNDPRHKRMSPSKSKATTKTTTQ